MDNTLDDYHGDPRRRKKTKEEAVFKLWDRRVDLVKQRIWAHLLKPAACEAKRRQLWTSICEVDAELATKWNVNL